MITEKAIKIIGIATTVIGIGTSLASDWVAEKKTDEKITQKVAEAIAKIKQD
jgi:2-keto-3-deoxy-6-phosphogluconate aldolase